VFELYRMDFVSVELIVMIIVCILCKSNETVVWIKTTSTTDSIRECWSVEIL